MEEFVDRLRPLLDSVERCVAVALSAREKFGSMPAEPSPAMNEYVDEAHYTGDDVWRARPMDDAFSSIVRRPIVGNSCSTS